MIFSLPKSALLSTALAALAIVTLAPKQVVANPLIQAIVQTNYNQINAAFLRKDIKGATALFTPDYVSISPEGEKQTLTEFRTHYNNLFSHFDIKLTSNKTIIKNIAVNSNGVDVAIEQRTEGLIAGSNKLEIAQTSRNFWLKTPQGWRLKQSKILTNQTTFNGKTFKG
jgi:ketosteroid isomerase-like protein